MGFNGVSLIRRPELAIQLGVVEPLREMHMIQKFHFKKSLKYVDIQD